MVSAVARSLARRLESAKSAQAIIFACSLDRAVTAWAGRRPTAELQLWHGGATDVGDNLPVVAFMVGNLIVSGDVFGCVCRRGLRMVVLALDPRGCSCAMSARRALSVPVAGVHAAGDGAR